MKNKWRSAVASAGIGIALILYGSPARSQSPSRNTLRRPAPTRADALLKRERPHLKLEGTGRACAGHLRVDARQVSWRSPFAACVADYRVLRHEGPDWTLKLQGNVHCKAFAVITLRKTDATVPASFWNVSGFQQGAATGQADLSCLMY